MSELMTDEAGSGGSGDGHVAIVHERLRDAILRGEIPAGHVTSQAALSAELQMGRTPLREALRLLQREGLVVSEPNRRVRIAGLSSSDAEEIYVMRFALEAVAIRVTVPRLVSADIAELQGLLAQMAHFFHVRDNVGFRTPHRAFHMALVAGAGTRVTDSIGRLFDHAERYRRSFGANTPELFAARNAEHRGIVDAIAAGEADLAAERLVRHYIHTVTLIFDGLDPTHDLGRLRVTVATVTPGAEDALNFPRRRASQDADR